MSPPEDHAPDWRDAAAYAPLREADRSLLAWEWLRRNRPYRAAAEQASESISRAETDLPTPERWGLHAFVPPQLSAPDALPVWRADAYPYVLPVEADPPLGPRDSFELESLPVAWTLVRASAREHLLISDGLRSIRLDVLCGTLSAGAVRLRYLLAGFESLDRPLLTLQRLLSLRRMGRLSRALHPPETRVRRFILMLRAFDALAAGAGQREIAAALLSGSAGQPRWRSEDPSLRSQVQRLVRGARRLAAGGYVELLR